MLRDSASNLKTRDVSLLHDVAQCGCAVSCDCDEQAAGGLRIKAERANGFRNVIRESHARFRKFPIAFETSGEESVARTL